MRNAEVRREIAAALAARREMLTREIRAKVAESRELDAESAPGEVQDNIDASQNAALAAMDRAEAERDLAELALVEAAEKRLADGTYGYCIACGEAIPVPRLRAAPAATRCTDCQTRAEHAAQ